MSVFLVCVVAYLLGSVPFGLLLTRFAGLGDIRAIGSGNIGATNVLRTGRKGLAAATLVLDGAKGTAAVFLAGHFGYPAPLCAGFAVFLGHLFPVYLGFKGGKGVATALGVFLGVSFLVGVLACLTWVGMAVVFRYSSLSSLAAVAVAPVVAVVFGRWELAVLFGLIAGMVVWKHAGNIGRLRPGTEPRIGKVA
jgi:glycerol-3-phosphate acyltransferase PlsY